MRVVTPTVRCRHLSSRARRIGLSAAIKNGCSPTLSDVQICAAVRDSQAPWPAAALTDTPARLLHRRTGLPLSACYRAVHRACDDGLLATGVSDDHYALTEAGTALLLVGDE
jgi:hypothetical protein